MHKTILLGLLAVFLLVFIPQVSTAQTSDSEGDTVSSCVRITSMYLTIGATDARTEGQVSSLQDFLIEKGLLTTPTGAPTGYYGFMTVVAVKAYQASKGISQVGSVGPMTRAAITADTCGTSSTGGTGGSTSTGSGATSTVGKPVFNFTTSSYSVEKGTVAKINWYQMSGADSCRASGDWSGSKKINGGIGGSEYFRINSPKHFVLTCTGPTGLTTTKSIDIGITQLDPGKPAIRLKVNGSDGPLTVPWGTDLNFTWSSNVPVTNCRPGAPFSGSERSYSPDSGTSGEMTTVVKSYTPQSHWERYGGSHPVTGNISSDYGMSCRYTDSEGRVQPLLWDTVRVISTPVVASSTTESSSGARALSLTVPGNDFSVNSGDVVTFTYDTTGHAGCSLRGLDMNGNSLFNQTIYSSAPKGTRTWVASRTSGFLLSCMSAGSFSSIAMMVDGVAKAFNFGVSSGITVDSGSADDSSIDTSSGTGSSIVPTIRYFVADPVGPLVNGARTKLMWDTNDARSCRLYTRLTTSATSTNDFGGAGMSVDTEEILLVTPLIGTTMYTLVCQIGNESVSKQVSIRVNSSSAPSTASLEPTIHSFNRGSSAYTSGQPVTLSWTTSNASSCFIEVAPDGGEVSVTTGIAVNGSKVYYPTQNTKYTLTCSNDVGIKTWERSVTVSPATTGGTTTTTPAPTTTTTVATPPPPPPVATAPAEPTFYAFCSRVANGTYSVVMAWNPVAGATNYPVRLSNAAGANTIIGVPPTNSWGGGTVPAAPTGTSYTFSNLAAGTYEYWGHAWNVAGWSSYTKKTVVCSPTASASQSATVALVATPSVLGATAQCVDISLNMHRGFESSSVTRLQEFLKSRDFLDEVTGFYGDKTVGAVKEYQALKGLQQSGMTYELTRSAIKGETCSF